MNNKNQNETEQSQNLLVDYRKAVFKSELAVDNWLSVVAVYYYITNTTSSLVFFCFLHTQLVQKFEIQTQYCLKITKFISQRLLFPYQEQ